MLMSTLKEAHMNSRPFQQIHFVFCSQPVDLQADLFADENGMAIHEECYVKRMTMGKSPTSSRQSEVRT
jgi:hypothetical protein